MMQINAMPWTSLATIAMLAVYFWASVLVGRARKAHGVPVPQTDGPEAFLRVFRAHMNTLEQLALTLPALWLFGAWANDCYAGIIGAVWCIGRILYVRGYVVEAQRRGPGFMVGFLASAVALFGALAAIVWRLVAA